MKEDPKMSKEENQLPSLHFKIQKLKERDWYGTALLIIVSGLILITTLIHAVMGFDESTPIVIINGLLIIIHMVLVFLSKTDKLLAYSGGLIVFLVYLILNQMLVDRMLVGGGKLSLIILSCYTLFIYEAYKLRKVQKQLEQ